MDPMCFLIRQVYSFQWVQKALEMKKIIVLCETGEPRYELISLLKKLFPECEIQILLRRFGSIE